MFVHLVMMSQIMSLFKLLRVFYIHYQKTGFCIKNYGSSLAALEKMLIFVKSYLA